MKLPQFIADAKQVIAVATAAIGEAVGVSLIPTDTGKTLLAVLGVAATALAAYKIPPSKAAALRAIKKTPR